MDFVITYKNELLAAVAIVCVFIAYILIKRKTSSSTDKAQEHIEQIEIKEETTPQQEEKQEQPVAQKPLQNQTPKIQKRAIPPHAKITKENFSEFAGARILVAEDNTINQKVIQGLLAESGIDIVIANDGEEALNILQKDNNFTLILMDAHMPNIDGFEATRQIRANSRYDHIAVIALSGDTAADDIKKMKDAGMSEHLEKPLQMDALYDVFYAYFTPAKPQEEKQAQKEAQQEISKEKESVLDIATGMEISGNDKEFYKEILQEFIKKYHQAHRDIRALLKYNKLLKADYFLLDLSGVTANIGAKQLHSTTLLLKKALKKGDQDIEQHLVTFKDELVTLLEEIEKYLREEK